MNSGPLLFLGVFFTLATSFWGLVLVPQMKLGRQEAVKIEATGQFYPPARGGQAQRGAEVYRSLGCVECHTQQVRGRGGDIARGWGVRRTVAQDYLGDSPVLVGSHRLGPDLANVGVRMVKPAELFLKLYQPQKVQPGSMMPPYRFLFETRRLKPGQPRSDIAAELGLDAPDGWEIVPTPEAEALVAYLLSLHALPPLYEAPLPKPPTPAPADAANAPAATADSAAAPSNPPAAPTP